MKNKSHSARRLLLLDDSGVGKIHVELEAFFDFSFWLAEELEDLVARWAHQSTPIATRVSRRKGSKLRPR